VTYPALTPAKRLKEILRYAQDFGSRLSGLKALTYQFAHAC
jgi:hypothetical protein